jgi:hypothetical protein
MLKQWGFALPLLFLLVAIQSLLEAVDQRDNRWNWASGMSGAALWLFMAGISWWVQ